ncbi:hydantoinase/oxoprolinase family protein [Mesorhizobium sp. M0088]|uniref:hydantoinase/oxoprolinase family protein n=1 Tax=Mesorhizobium sp. M0088 TaxID=2956873 RepID=UPI00333B7900
MAAVWPGLIRVRGSKGSTKGRVQPRPACYSCGDVDPTITDASVVLGFIPPWPIADGGLSVSAELAAKAMEGSASRLSISRQEVARRNSDPRSPAG